MYSTSQCTVSGQKCTLLLIHTYIRTFISPCKTLSDKSLEDQYQCLFHLISLCHHIFPSYLSWRLEICAGCQYFMAWVLWNFSICILSYSFRLEHFVAQYWLAAPDGPSRARASGLTRWGYSWVLPLWPLQLDEHSGRRNTVRRHSACTEFLPPYIS